LLDGLLEVVKLGRSMARQPDAPGSNKAHMAGYRYAAAVLTGELLRTMTEATEKAKKLADDMTAERDEALRKVAKERLDRQRARSA
jgi:hypothetical protein